MKLRLRKIPFRVIEKYRYAFYVCVSIVGGGGTWLLSRWLNGEPIEFDNSIYRSLWFWYAIGFAFYYIAERNAKKLKNQ